jgi:hypothetical protein
MANLNIPENAQNAVNYLSYLAHLVKDKPVLVAIGAITSSVFGRILGVLPDHIISIMALVVLVSVDWFTKRDACIRQGVPFTSGLMRKKGALKLRDYMLLYMAGAMTIPLMGDMWGYRSVLYFICICELWSIAENLNDAGRLPFDIRHLALFDMIRDMMSGKPAAPPDPGLQFPGMLGGVPQIPTTLPGQIGQLPTIPGQIPTLVPPATTTAPVNHPSNPAGNQGG